MRLIDADNLKIPNDAPYKASVKRVVAQQPTVEAVPKSYAEQIRWERDVAVGQLNEIGCQFGQKMDEVKKKLEAVPVVYGEWIHVPSSDMATGRAYECSNCKKMRYGSFMPPFCQMCGADMRTSAE